MRVAVLASGSGTNLQALLDAEAAGTLSPATIALVLCNRPGAKALDRATAAGKPAVLVDHKLFADRESFERAMLQETDQHQVDAIVLAGFMRVLTNAFLDRWDGRILNTHPSLLPAFPGVRAHQQALDYGVKLTGCTIHFVEPALDGGPVILQAAVEVMDHDTEETLHSRILAQEHQLLPRAVRLLAQGRLQREGRRVRIR